MRRLLLVSALFLSSTGNLSAQNTLRGRVIDRDSRPVQDIEVMLHRVTEQGGGPVDRDTSDATGAFTLVAPADTAPNAIYFVAIREGGELFMGEMQRLPFPDTLEYIVEAVDPVDLGPAAEAVPPSPEERRAGLYVVFTGVLLVAGVLFLVLRRRPPAHRRVLVQLAQLREEDTSSAAARRRAQLYARLKRQT